jgi:uncharacterized protein (DUF2141 family)
MPQNTAPSKQADRTVRSGYPTVRSPYFELKIIIHQLYPMFNQIKKNTMKNILLIALTVFSFIYQTNAQTAETITLTIAVEGVVSKKGTLILHVYNSESDWLTNDYKLMKIDLASTPDHTFKIEGIPAGTYGFSAVQDENNNDELDMGMMGPEEAYGFSNDARGTYGPASFKEAALELNRDSNITIRIY